jgi:hypothetical protein
VTSAAVAAATKPLPQPLAIHAPVVADFANMTLIVRPALCTVWAVELQAS